MTFFLRIGSSEQLDGLAVPINNATPDKEMLAIVKGFGHFRQYLEGAAYPVKVLTDHADLTVFMAARRRSLK